MRPFALDLEAAFALQRGITHKQESAPRTAYRSYRLRLGVSFVIGRLAGLTAKGCVGKLVLRSELGDYSTAIFLDALLGGQ